jgi:VWFA-related protein
MIRLIIATLVAASLTQAGAQRFKTGIEVVRVDALVTADRRPIAGLTAEDFELRDSGVRQTVTDVSFERLPLNIICVLDVSGSVSGQPLVRLREGTAAVIDALAADDRAALISFSNRLKIHAALTQDKTVLRDALSSLTSEGATALLDATFAGLALREIDPGRTLLLLFSDGIDTASWLTARKVLDAARRTDVVIYPVSVRGEMLPMNTTRSVLVRPRGDQSGDSLLDALAEESGGRRFIAERQTDLRQSFLDVLKEFRQRYVLTYTPTGVPADGWHPIEVRVKTRGAEVTARRGYYASK